MKPRNECIYVFTRDYIPSRVKIGSSSDWQGRLWDANHSEWNCGEKWHCLAILDKSMSQEDIAFHRWIGKKYPKLASTKIQEFFEATPSEIQTLLKEYAKESGIIGRGVYMNPGHDPCFAPGTYKFTPSRSVKFLVRESSLNNEWQKGSKLTFPQRGIPVGATLDYILDSTKKCTVVGPREVEFEGVKYKTLTELTCALKKCKRISGTSFWKYNGRLVREIGC